MPGTVRLILGDQLNAQHSWFKTENDDVQYVMMEMRQETDYVRHHIQKVVGFFAAMRAFAEARQAEGHEVRYFKLDDADNQQDLIQNLRQVMDETGATRFEYQLPDEYRLDQQLSEWVEAEGLDFAAVDTEHFLTGRMGLAEMFKGKKTYLMERFYRQMRMRYNIMMESEKEPLTGQWNYDADNRNRYDGKVPVPSAEGFGQDVLEILAMVDAAGVEYFGEMDAANYLWPTTREQAEEALDFFVKECLPHFGTYQDAMSKEHWALFHARISFPLNIKILHPLEVVNKAVAHWEANQNQIDIAQIEGFVRQIIGWREYMRGVYWAHMPEYATRNHFGYDRKLPGWFWTGDTKMNCLHHAIRNSLDHAYAHHIQRLMVTGNFALLAGIDPDEVDQWYLGIYIDAIEWVEITNTRGMSQYADGGLVGSKPYVSSANYIDKMSDYCKGCHYNKKKRVGEGACPFNSLYWHFYDRHEDKLSKHPRIGFAYRNLNRMKPEDKAALLEQAEGYLAGIEEL
ncbi:MAG: cryptochrome/photolyase family protein [Bacteroidota bacterium]